MALSTITGQSYARWMGRIYRLRPPGPPRYRSSRPIYHQHGRAPHLSFTQRLQAFVGLLQRKSHHLRADRHLRGQGEEFLAVLAGQVRHRAYHTFTPEDLVREGWYIAHVDAGAHH